MVYLLKTEWKNENNWAYTSLFEYFGTPLEIVSVLKQEYIDYCHPGSAKNILTLNQMYRKGSGITKSFSSICKIYLRPNLYKACWNFIKSVLKNILPLLLLSFFKMFWFFFLKFFF